MGKYCFGIDVGGTSVKCGLFQTDGVLVEKVGDSDPQGE